MSKAYNVLESFEKKGYFRLPASKDTIAGILTFSPSDGIHLDLFGSLHDTIEETMKSCNERIDCIWGELEDGNDVTLFRCFYSIKIQNFVLERYSCQYLLVGDCIASPDEKLYTHIETEYPVLTMWCNYQLVRTDITDKIATTIPIDLCAEELSKANIGNDKTLSLQMRYVWRCENIPREFYYSQKAMAVFEYDSPRSLFDISSDAERFSSFLSFVTLKNQIWSTVCIIEEKKSLYLIHQPDENFSKVKCVVPSREYLLDFVDIKDVFSELIKKWYDDSKFIPIVGHLTDSVTYHRTFTENNFLTIAQALDGYSKRFIHTNETESRWKFEKRLNEMILKFKTLTIFNGIELSGDIIADTRNYYAHLGLRKKDGKEIVDPSALYHLTFNIRKLLICYMMEFLGFSKDDIDNLTKKSTSQKINRWD